MPDRWKVLVISDTHRELQTAESVIRTFEHHIDAVYFLGDYYEDGMELSRRFPVMAFRSIPGNCDFGMRAVPVEISVADHHLLLCHGHQYAVKEGLEHLYTVCRSGGYDVCLFGHTHRAHIEEKDGILLVNPGSIGPTPRSEENYAVLKLVKGQKAEAMLGSSQKSCEKLLKFLR